MKLEKTLFVLFKHKNGKFLHAVAAFDSYEIARDYAIKNQLNCNEYSVEQLEYLVPLFD